MARPRKQTVDYFPHYCTHGKTMFIIEQKYGNDGYAFWFKLLEILGTSEGHYFHLENIADWEFLQAKTHFEQDKCREILDLLANLKAIDKELWFNHEVIWSDNFVANIKEAYKKRTVKTPSKPSFRTPKPTNKGVSSPGNPQMKVNEMKANESKVNKSSKVFADDSAEMSLVNKLLFLIRQNNPNFKEPNVQKWAKDFNSIIRIDKRSPEEIEQVMTWAQQNDFWKSNILSPDKLRKKYDTLYIQMNTRKGNSLPKGFASIQRSVKGE